MSFPEIPTLERFRGYVGTRFSVEGARGEGGTWELVEVVAHPRHQSGGAEKFSLVFSADVAGGTGQGLVGLNHPELGRLVLFVVPVAPGASGRPQFEAVINREGGRDGSASKADSVG